VCHIVLPYPEVSGKHCQLDLHEGQWHVRDLGSRNGIQVDGKPQTAAPLKANAILSIAKHRFKIVYEPKINDFELGNEPIATIDLGEVMPTDRVMFDVFPEPARDFEGADSDEHSASDICAAP
jgi:pSer/pThr/pTyr-binding forkhead associated (FHA) protein